jgi:class 3 adenylate cyclase
MDATLKPVGQGTRSRGTLLLADISGYTGFLQGVADAHYDLIVEADAPPPAYGLVASLLDGIVADLVPPFHLVKFEGDAVFVVAAETDDDGLRGPDVLDRLRACHAAFRVRLGEANERWTCTCDSCARIHELDLKFVLHHGEYVLQQVGQQEELLGPDVNIAHRLLKNHAIDLIGPRPYALLSDSVIATLGVPVGDMLAATETYDRVPPVPVHVLALA